MLKKIKKLDVEAESIVEIVQNSEGRELILKTTKDSFSVLIEKKFIEILTEYNLPHLCFFEDESLFTNQLLLEYIQDSPTLAKKETLFWIEKWGSLINKVHAVQSEEAKKMFENGELQALVWKDFLIERYDIAVKKHKISGIFDEEVLENMRSVLEKLCSFDVFKYSLIHSDLHTNNAMIRNDEVVIFDKGNAIFFGDPAYDLAIFFISFGFSDLEDDEEKVEAFKRGYDQSYFEVYKEKIELYTLFRAFERSGNRF